MSAPDPNNLSRTARIASLFASFSKPSVYALSTLIITVLGSATTLLAPALLTSSQFAAFILLASFFQLTSRLDFGLSELADRYGTRETDWNTTTPHLIKLRWLIGLISLPLIILFTLITPQTDSLISSFDLALALSGGLLAMIAVGPVTLFRAQNKIQNFAVLALFLQLGMTAPRLLGLALGGTTGCYLALFLWYMIIASPSWRQFHSFRLKPKEMFAPLRHSSPLFLCALLWLAFQFMPRWISALISSRDDFSALAFSFSLMALATGTLTTIGQAYYPRYITLARNGVSQTLQTIFSRDVFIVTGVSFIALGLFMPFIPYGLLTLYPRYMPALGETLVMSLSLLPFVPMLWFMPLILSITKHPLRMIGVMTAPTGLLLFISMTLFYDHAGREGQSFAILISIILALFIFSVILIAEKLMTRSRAFLFYGMIGILTLALLGEARWLIGPKGLISLSFPEYGTPNVTEIPHAYQSAGSRLIFSEEFNRLRLIHADPQGVWEPHFPWGDRSISQNGELQYYLDPRPGRDPSSLQQKETLFVRDGVLHLRANMVKDGDQHLSGGQPFVSAMLSSARGFSFTYGYVEIRARIPKGAGLWPALWLLPITQAWPPEIDIAEMIGKTPTRYFASVHAREFGFRINSTFPIDTYDLSEKFSTFGLKWTREKIEWTFNGKTVAEYDTPSDLHQPMYLLVNLAVGGLWGGIPDDPSVFPADFLIDYIRVYDIER